MADGAKTVNGFGLASRGTGIKGAPVDIATGERPQDRLRIPTPQPEPPVPKADGRSRPLGIATLEDKIVQRAVVEVLNAVYEVDFLGFSYGFRPGRGPHHALDALAVGMERKQVNWELDADIREFFTSFGHRWLMKFLEHRIADQRVLRLIRKWLNAGVIENGKWSQTVEGAPQGASASPLLANVYLHYVFDLWVPAARGGGAWEVVG